PFDLAVATFIQGLRTPTLTGLFMGITEIGSPLTVIAVGLSTVLLISKHKGEAHYFMVLTTVGGSALFNELLKVGFQRPRPTLTRLVEVSGYSFPSGHAMISASLYGLLAYLLWRNYRTWPARVGACFLVVLTLLVGFSRVYLGVHYPSDVLGGFAAGVFWLTICILTSRALAHRKLKRG
ncbi:MAG TPA: phosphatase PAP2 family protein, partial [Bacillota bacterium]|nr:phosphatase PAP2 family protein [Bacillota bacterium]